MLRILIVCSLAVVFYFPLSITNFLSIQFVHASVQCEHCVLSDSHAPISKPSKYDQRAPASFRRFVSCDFFSCRSLFPPMCFPPMKMFGTEVWPVISPRAAWIAEPSSIRQCQLGVFIHYIVVASTYRLGQARSSRTWRPFRSRGTL